MTRSRSSLSASVEKEQELTPAQKQKLKAKAVSPYSKEEQLKALDSLLQGSDDPDFDGRHLFGYKDSNHEPSMLQIITATRILDTQSAQETGPSMKDLEQQAHAFAQQHGPMLDLQAVIHQQASTDTMALAAEFKRASPSKGLMAANANITAADQTSMYAQAGANIISILTEPRWFLGGLDDLTEARIATTQATSALNNDQPRPAILCKEFVVNEYMIAQAAAAGADTVLLIVAVLPQHILANLIAYARHLGMEPLVEVHALPELDVALAAGARVIGVNNRNLHTFQMDLTNSERIADEMTRRGLSFRHAGDEYSLCALSGMSSAVDVHRYRQAGLQMCLIGESLMRSSNPLQAIQGLCLNKNDYENSQRNNVQTIGGAYTQGCQLIKVCGITNPEDALVACQAGVNLIGVIFAEKSKRRVTAEQAHAVVSAVRDFGERQERASWPAASSDASALTHLVSSAQQLVQTATTRRPLVVGVFQNQDPAFIAQMVQDCGLDLVQLHGKEGFAAASPEQCGGVPAIRVVDITVDPETGKAADNAVEQILESLTNDPAAILLDTAIMGQSEGGGTSTTFDWGIAQAVQNAGLPVLVAGGLTSGNVGECISQTRPFGVDVSSGVEASPGKKNHDEVQAFVKTARQAAIEASQGF